MRYFLRIAREKTFARYAMTLVVVAASFALRYGLVKGLGLHMPLFITFYPAVMLAALVGRLWAGLLATAICVVGADYVILPPIEHLSIQSASDAAELGLFAIMGVFISLLAEYYRRSQQAIAALKQEQALWPINQKLELALARMTDAVFISDATGHFIHINDAFAKFHRFNNKAECACQFSAYTNLLEISQPNGELVPVDNWSTSRALRGETGASIEYRLRRKDTGESWLGSYNFAPLRDAQGAIVGCVVVARDITEERKKENHIRRLARVYAVLSDINQTIVRVKDTQAMLEAVCRIAVDKGEFRMVWVGMLDLETQIVKPVASAGAVDGYLEHVKISLLDPTRSGGPAARTILSGQHVLCNDIEHDPSCPPWKEEALRRGYRSSASFPLKDTEKVVGLLNVYAGEPGFFVGDQLALLDEMAMDISFALEVNRNEKERVRAEEELRWRTAFFEAQVESALDGVLVVDEHARKILQNERFNEILRIPPEIAGNADSAPQLQFVASIMKDPDQFAEKVDYLKLHPDEVSRDEIELQNGTILDGYSSPVRDKEGYSYGRIWTFRDITEKRRLEEQFRQAQKMEAVGQLTGGIAHDFNNLLTVILGCSEILSEDVEQAPRLKKMAGMIADAARQGAELTRRMLAFARRQTLQPKVVDINGMLASMEKFLRRTLSANIDLEVIHADKDCGAIVDQTQLESALLNLCVNSRDAMPDGGRLSIEVRKAELDADYADANPGVTPGTYVLITVSDTGCGIDESNLSRVFDPFFTTKEAGKGTGLGLSMVYGFVKQSSGHVRIYSEPEHGTVVKLFLPRAEQKNAAAVPQEKLASDLRGTETILLVEDNVTVRELAKSQLIGLGYTVFEAGTGQEALAVLARHPEIELLFTDMVMPGGMNGYELAAEVRRHNSKLKVLYCSGYARDTIAHERWLDEGVQLLNKPYTRAELAKRLREVLSES